MNVDQMRRVDRLAGVPLCWALSGLRRLRDLAGRRPAPAGPPRRILVLHLSEMGSTVLALPALEWLKRRLPDAELHFLVFPPIRECLETLGVVPPERIFTVDPKGGGRLVRSLAAALRQARQAGIDAVVDFEGFSRFSALVGYLACPTGRRIGYHPFTAAGLYRGDLLTHRVLFSPHLPARKGYLLLVRALLAEGGEEPVGREVLTDRVVDPPEVTCPPEHLQSVEAKLADLGIGPDTPLLLLNPNSSDMVPQRRWPLTRFAQVGRRFLEEWPEFRVLVTGGANERPEALRLVEELGDERVADFTGRTSFGELLALHARADLLITNDSGPAHFAALMRLPTVVLFGPEVPKLFAPLGDRFIALHADLACSPCVTVYNGKESPCRDNRCLQAIQVDTVLDACRDLMAQFGTERRLA